MKLSEIRGERTFDVLGDLVAPVLNIASDEKAVAFFRDRERPEGQDVREFAARKAKETLPALLKGHKADLVAIMAALNGMEPGEYAETLTLASLLSDLTELLSDEGFTAFLS